MGDLSGAGVCDRPVEVGFWPITTTTEATVDTREPAAERTVLLVCEGSCNPNLAVIDEWVARERARMEECRDGKTIGLSGAVVGAMRDLQHTPHRLASAGVYQCTACGGYRKYGTD